MVKANNTQKYRVGKNKYLKRLNLEKVDKAMATDYSIHVRGGHNKKLVSNIIGRYNFYHQNPLPKEINDMIELQVNFAQQAENNALLEQNLFPSLQFLVCWGVRINPWDDLISKLEWRAKVQSEQQFKAFNSLQNNEVIANYFHNPQECLIEVPVWRSSRNR